MAPAVASSNVVLPPIRTLFPYSAFHSSPSSSPSSDEEIHFTPLKQKQSPHEEQYHTSSRYQFPQAPFNHVQHSRRVSTASTASSVPSLTFSPSPSPPPSPCSSPQRIRLVPCTMQAADVVVVAAEPRPPISSSQTLLSSSSGHCFDRPINRAVLLVGPAISRAAKDERKMHPYRILRERRSE